MCNNWCVPSKVCAHSPLSALRAWCNLLGEIRNVCAVVTKWLFSHLSAPLSLSISFQSLTELFDIYRICMASSKLTNHCFEAAVASVQSGTKVVYPQHSCLFESDELLNAIVRHPQLLKRIQDILQTLKYLRCDYLYCHSIYLCEARMAGHLDLVSCKGPVQSVIPW